MTDRERTLEALCEEFGIDTKLPEEKKITLQKMDFSRVSPNGGYFDCGFGVYKTDTIESILKTMNKLWISDNITRFDDVMADHLAFRFLSWDIIAHTLIQHVDSYTDLEELFSVISEIEDGYEYDMNDIWLSLEDEIAEADDHYYALENIFSECEDDEKEAIRPVCGDDCYDSFARLLELEAINCCDIDSPYLVQKLEENAGEIVYELYTIDAFCEGQGSNWWSLFDEEDDSWSFEEEEEEDENKAYYEDLMETGWDPESDID